MRKQRTQTSETLHKLAIGIEHLQYYVNVKKILRINILPHP
jgi:hypothetical protein